MPKKNRKLSDNATLVLAARAIQSNLRQANVDACFFNAEKINSDGGTGGWDVSIAQVGGNGPLITLWLDRFTGMTGRRFYAGFYEYGKPRMREFISSCRKALQPVLVVHSSDVADGTINRLRKPLAVTQFSRPICEELWQGACFFGIYDSGNPSNPATVRRFVDRSTRFLLDVLDDREASQADDLGFPTAIERSVQRLHRHHERDTSLADQCKRRDGYSCRVCNLCFPTLYGANGYGANGAEIIDSHHTRPLKDLNGDVETSLDDLIAVCPNCHRVLHCMGQECWNWRTLRKIVNQHRNPPLQEARP